MIHVLATISVKPGTREAFLRHFLDNVPNVLAEDGCHGYQPAVDTPSGISAQSPLRDNAVVVIEKWESIDHLKAHLQAPHMAAYREKVKDMVTGVELRILENAR